MKNFFVYFAISVSSFAEGPVSKGRNMLRAVSLFSLTALALVLVYADAVAQSSLKKVRIGVSETHVGYLPLQVAFHKGYYKDEGIDLEIVLMATNVINTAALTGEIDINGAVTGTVGAAVQGSPLKLLIVTVGKPLLFLVSRKEIKDPRALKGKKIAGSSPGGSATNSGETSLESLRPGSREGRRGASHGGIHREPFRRHGERRGGRDGAAGAAGHICQGEGIQRAGLHGRHRAVSAKRFRRDGAKNPREPG